MKPVYSIDNVCATILRLYIQCIIMIRVFTLHYNYYEYNLLCFVHVYVCCYATIYNRN